MKKILSVILSIVILLGCLPIGTVFAAEMMTTSDQGVEYLKSVEGFSKYPYYDYGQYTVGYGTRCPGDKYNYYKANGITEEEANELLKTYLATVETVIHEKLINKYGLQLSQHQFDALVSYTYNLGPGWLYNSSNSFHKAIMEGCSGSELIRIFSLYCHAGNAFLSGLMNRRLCEANMFINGVYSKSVNPEYGYVRYEFNGGKANNDVQGYIISDGVKPIETPTKDDITFLGWFTTFDGGEPVTVLDASTNGKTLFARWDEAPLEDNFDDAEVVVTGDSVNIRSGPSTSYTKVGTANKGDKLLITNIANCSTYTWGKFDGGWICLSYTSYGKTQEELDKIFAPKVEDSTNETQPPAETQPEESNPETPLPEESTSPTEPPTEDTIPPVVEESTPTEPPVTEPPVEESTQPTKPAPVEPEQEITSEPEYPKNGYVKVDTCLCVRSGPGTTNPVLGYMWNNQKVTIYEETQVGDMKWGRVGDNKWVSLTYVELIISSNGDDSKPETTPTTPDDSESTTQKKINGIIKADCLRIRSAAGTSNKIIGYYYQNDKVVIIETVYVDSDQWGKTDKGWIAMSYVTVVDNNEFKTITADCLRIRSDAGTSNKIIGYYYKDDQVVIIETKNDADGDSWGKTDKGWVSLKFTK